MKLLQIENTLTLSQLTDLVGSKNIDTVLATNQISRSPNIGKSYENVCSQIISENRSVSKEQKINILNSVTKDSDIFESVALQDENGWKVMASVRSLPGMLNVPESIGLPESASTLGNNKSISPLIHDKAISNLRSSGHVDPSIFNEYSTAKHRNNVFSENKRKVLVFQNFHIPWGEILLYSSMDNESKDIPVYPEELSDSRSANYTQMPDMLYQYEPWQVYQSSGPRQGSYTFKIHRDMWTGDHNDGLANDLIRFCQANCYPRYNGSAVNTSIVTLYIAGKSFISGVLTSVDTEWSGPIGHDGWYLVCDLKLTFTEVSEYPLNYDSIRKKPIIG